jgi:hypothetical protein
MGNLIKRRGHQIPKGKATREELCAIIKEHGLVVTPPTVPKPVVAPAPAPVAPVAEVAKIKNFIASQNVVVEKPKESPKLVVVPHLPEKKLWELYTKKLTNEIYETIPKNGEYENRMNQARSKAMKVVRDMKAKGDPAPAHYIKK